MQERERACIGELKGIFARNRDEVFLVDVGTGREFTYGTLEDLSLRLVSYLKAEGIGKGDRVAVILPNSIECSLLFFACMQMGAVIVPINQRLRAEEIRTLLDESGARTLFVATHLLEEHASDLPSETKVIPVAVRLTADARALASQAIGADLMAEAERAERIATESFDGLGDNDDFALVYTSGTTSRPKGIRIQYGRMFRNAKTFAGLFDLPRGQRFLGTFSQGYLGGLYNTLLFQFFTEGSVALDAGFDVSVALRFWETVKKHNVTALWLVPSMLSIILSLDRSSEGETYARERLSHVFIGTAPLPLSLKTTFEERYGVLLYENFALSETFFISTDHPSLQHNRGVGKLLPGCELTILAEDGTACPAGVPGEIVVKSPFMATEYERNPEASAAFRDGVMYTGDVGYLDEEGYLFVMDRKKDIIIRGGINISPKEVEDCLLAHPAVADVAVVGVPHPVRGEDVVAVIVPAPDAGNASDADLLKHCADTLAPFKVPAAIFRKDALPRTATGKVQKRALREWVATQT